ncbi:MAG: ABC transporter ATP-binding protein [Bacillota bacterium]|nr:ABC transporter ATP-binding protein [Bacillota bacterium]
MTVNTKGFHMENVSVGYNGKPLIRDIALDIRPGEILTLIGPNGSGKSTILKSITRQLKLIKGNVMFDGENLGELSFKELSSRMAVMLTERLKPELMTCYDIVATGRYPYTGKLGFLTAKDERMVEEAMEAVNATEVGHCDFSAISDGQRQRVMLARAICQDPDVMILDEPTSFLDIKHKLDLLHILRRMTREKGITVVMSLHEIDLAQKISDKIVCVKGETIFRYGEPDDIFNEETIQTLYDMDKGYFDTTFGSIELPGPVGEPETLVLSSSGRGIAVYRQLQRICVPFTAAVVYTNDLDYELARIMAADVITEKPFEEISDDTFNRVKSAVENCSSIVIPGVDIGSCNRRMNEIIKLAEDSGKVKTIDQIIAERK